MYILYDHISKIYYDYNIFFKSINGINYNSFFYVQLFKYCPFIFNSILNILDIFKRILIFGLDYYSDFQRLDL